MPLINYNNPDYQRLMQRAMANPLARTNPNAARTKVQRQYVTDREGIRTKLNDVQLSHQSFLDRNKFQNREMGLRENRLASDLGFMRAGHQLRNQEFKDKKSDATKGLLWGLAPMAYGIYEGNRRKKQTDADNAYNRAWQESIVESTPGMRESMKKRGQYYNG